MYVARNLKKEGKLYYAWTDVGKMKIRTREGAQTTVIKSLEDLYAAADPERRAGAAAAAPSDDEGFGPVAGRGRSGGRRERERRAGCDQQMAHSDGTAAPESSSGCSTLSLSKVSRFVCSASAGNPRGLGPPLRGSSAANPHPAARPSDWLTRADCGLPTALTLEQRADS